MAEYTPEGFLQTASGIKFVFNAPTLDMIDITDIAHALGNICRYNGHCKEFYCPTPDQKILTSDLRWVPAGDLKVGDGLIGFDESPHQVGSTGKNRRRFRPSHVTHIQPVKRKIIRLEMSDGSTVRASAEHPWLIATKQSRNQVWAASEKIHLALKAGRKRYMHKFSQVWEDDKSFSGGWLSGICDGEGHLSAKNRGGTQMGIAQNPGWVLNNIQTQLRTRGFDFGITHVGTSSVISIQIKGGWREILRLCGTVRPQRLLNKFGEFLGEGAFDKQMDGIGYPLEIIKSYEEPDDWVVGMETSTHTYLCEGYAAHNSVAEHSVLLAGEFMRRYPDHPTVARAFLLHDAAEAYLCDLPRPIKYAVVGYREAEAVIESLVYRKFEVPDPLPSIVKEWDHRICVDEKAQAMAHRDHTWGIDDFEPLGIKLQFWSPKEASNRFLIMFKALSL